LVVAVVDFFAVDLAGVFALDFVVPLTAVVRLVAVLAVAVDLLVVRGADLLEPAAEAVFGSGSVAIASMRGAGFFGLAART
jgi:hypothetical protein